MTRRLLARLAAMDRAELVWRSRTVAHAMWDRARFAVAPPAWQRGALASLLVPSAEVASIRRAATGREWVTAHRELARYFSTSAQRFVIAPGIRATTAERIRSRFPESTLNAIARADRILAGNYDLLGYRGLRFDSPTGRVDWHYDPVHDRRAPPLFWSTVPFLNPECGDHKIIWELNRHQHWLVLGRAFWLTGRQEYRQHALKELSSWIDANPPLMGINWTSMLELAFRSLSWLWAINFFADPHAADESPWLVDLLVALDRQLDHIERNLSRYFSPNTHLLGEALALYVAGRTLPLLRSSARRTRIGRAILLAEMHQQIAPDGGHCERSTHYHRYALDFYLLALSIARITHDSAVDEFARAVARLAFAARLLADDHGCLPHIGDDDGGSTLPLVGRPVDDIADSLATAAALVERPDLRVGTPPEECCWLLAHPVLAGEIDAIAGAPFGEPIASAALPDTGYYVSRSGAGDHLVIDAGPHGYRNGGHAHADALSLTLSVRGTPLLIDLGTGCYTVNPVLRDRFRLTAAHNTLVLDERPQSIPSGPFHWSHTAQAVARRWRANAGFDYLEGSHDGYRPIEHRRHVLALHGDLMIVADLVVGEGPHRADVHWHIDPRWRVTAAGRRALLAASGERVELVVTHGLMQTFSADRATGLGRHAPVYGREEPATTIRVGHTGGAPMWMVSVFGFDRSNEVLDVETLPLWAEAGVLEQSLAVRIVRTASTDCFLVVDPRNPADGKRTDQISLRSPDNRATSPAGRSGLRLGTAPTVAPELSRATWRVGEIETDARMLFCRTNPAGEVSRVALVDGSVVRSSARRRFLLAMPREVPDLHVDVGRVPDGTTSGPEAHLSGPAFGARIEFAGRDLPIAIECRSTARPRGQISR
jgi:uncharacterized heparinase superfamily protein